MTSKETVEVKEMKVVEDRTALELLQKIYRDTMVPLPTRMRAAIESLPYENPKLSAVGIGVLNAQDFASRLDRAIDRSGRTKLIEGNVVEEDQ